MIKKVKLRVSVEDSVAERESSLVAKNVLSFSAEAITSDGEVSTPMDTGDVVEL